MWYRRPEWFRLERREDRTMVRDPQALEAAERKAAELVTLLTEGVGMDFSETLEPGRLDDLARTEPVLAQVLTHALHALQGFKNDRARRERGLAMA
jgi:hypothetical protein